MFVDTGVLFDAIAGRPQTVEALDGESQIHSSTISITEYLEGRIQAGCKSISREMDRLPGVNWRPYTKPTGIKAGHLQLELEQTGDRLGQRDLMIAATALEVGDDFLVTDNDFQVPAIENEISVLNLRE